MKNLEKPKKNEIWSWKWKHFSEVYTSNIIDINDEYFQLAMFNRKPNIRKIKLTDVEFLNNFSTSSDGSMISTPETIVKANKIAKPDVFSRLFTNTSSLQQIKESVCEHEWVPDSGSLVCTMCNKTKDEDVI